ncbi:MAG: type 1 glutamine amidotransferase [bacterium]|nr:type 1 glutamine amidotransferase [bacterium]
MKLKGRTIAVLVEQDYQDLEVWYPVLRLREEGATVKLMGTGSAPEYRGKFGYPAKPDIDVRYAKAGELDGLVIPGGWAPDRLRTSQPVLELVKAMNAARKPIACICHGGWVLSSAGILEGRNMTGVPAIRDDMIYAGANWQDSEVVVDGNLVTSRRPDDLPAFMRTFLQLF